MDEPSANPALAVLNAIETGISGSFSDLDRMLTELSTGGGFCGCYNHIYVAVGNCAFWIIHAYERTNKSEYFEEDIKYIRAIKALFNAYKHCNNLTWIFNHEFYGSEANSEFVWGPIEDCGLMHKNEIIAYNEVLFNKNIILTLKKAIEVVEKHLRNLL